MRWEIGRESGGYGDLIFLEKISSDIINSSSFYQQLQPRQPRGLHRVILLASAHRVLYRWPIGLEWFIQTVSLFFESSSSQISTSQRVS